MSYAKEALLLGGRLQNRSSFFFSFRLQAEADRCIKRIGLAEPID
jgi:hypothetical protein